MDGFFKGRRLFSAPYNGAVLVSGDRLRNPRSVSILDEDPAFSFYSFPSRSDHYPDEYSTFRYVVLFFSLIFWKFFLLRNSFKEFVYLLNKV